MSLANEVRYTARSITPPGADRDSESPPPKRRAALPKSPPLPPPPPFPPKGAVRIISSRSPSRRRSTSRSPPPKRRGRSRSPSPRKRGRSRSPSPKKRGRSRSPSPKRRGRSRSRSRSRNRSRSRSRNEQRNPGNNLYVTGLSTRTSSSDLEKFFSKEGKVQDCHIVIDPRSKESRGFAFVTMENVEDARRCIKYLHRSVLEGRLISVAKAVCKSTEPSSTSPATLSVCTDLTKSSSTSPGTLSAPTLDLKPSSDLGVRKPRVLQRYTSPTIGLVSM